MISSGEKVFLWSCLNGFLLGLHLFEGKILQVKRAQEDQALRPSVQEFLLCFIVLILIPQDVYEMPVCKCPYACRHDTLDTLTSLTYFSENHFPY